MEAKEARLEIGGDLPSSSSLRVPATRPRCWPPKPALQRTPARLVDGDGRDAEGEGGCRARLGREHDFPRGGPALRFIADFIPQDLLRPE